MSNGYGVDLEDLEGRMMAGVRGAADAMYRLRELRTRHRLTGDGDQAPGEVLLEESRLKREVNEYKIRLLMRTSILRESGRAGAFEAYTRVRMFYEEIVGEPYLSGYKYTEVTPQNGG